LEGRAISADDLFLKIGWSKLCQAKSFLGWPRVAHYQSNMLCNRTLTGLPHYLAGSRKKLSLATRSKSGNDNYKDSGILKTGAPGCVT
jgi:hypothetical protein